MNTGRSVTLLCTVSLVPQQQHDQGHSLATHHDLGNVCTLHVCTPAHDHGHAHEHVAGSRLLPNPCLGEWTRSRQRSRHDTHGCPVVDHVAPSLSIMSMETSLVPNAWDPLTDHARNNPHTEAVRPATIEPRPHESETINPSNVHQLRNSGAAHRGNAGLTRCAITGYPTLTA